MLEIHINNCYGLKCINYTDKQNPGGPNMHLFKTFVCGLYKKILLYFISWLSMHIQIYYVMMCYIYTNVLNLMLHAGATDIQLISMG